MLYKNRFVLAGGWLVLMSFLFCLPGSALPKTNWLNEIYFDKWVHVGLFGVLLWLWMWAMEQKIFSGRAWMLCLLAAAYGLLVEIVQDQFIPNRSWDVGDWIADVGGIALGSIVYLRYIKKIDPCRNRGRNQN